MGLLLGFVLIFLVTVGFSFILLLMDKQLEGFTTLLSTVIALGGLFIYNQKQKNKNQSPKK